MTIVLTNDDGIEAEGLAHLADALDETGPLVAVAPCENRSGVGHAITIHMPVQIREEEVPRAATKRLSVSGTPADAVKYALLHESSTPPRLVVSGINNGPNVGINVHYSGTVGAALEAVMIGIPSVALSLDRKQIEHWETGRHYAREAVRLALALAEERAASDPAAPPFCLNVNIPDRPLDAIRGLRITRNGTSGFRELFHPVEGSSAGEGYRIHGDMHLCDPDEGYDAIALAEGYVSLTPLRIDLTDWNLHRTLLERQDRLASTESESTETGV